ncbi:uncharacterized protein FIBRA_01391 [Fibroporia radiculosa]|uniref:Uncharacterized protein n=1 Tax=Fibroporia radiculosa TaxID=599839 RepID=J4G0Y7_9APHY|nr:uncharacterized protein FIBRA_01391 [Fibroporia radiculosa]CCL99373.1 predicted protein [Fibroporia radiculosa]
MPALSVILWHGWSLQLRGFIWLGGWWTRPSNWRANTAIAFGGILAITYGAWTVSADKEVRRAIPPLSIGNLTNEILFQFRHIEPFRPIPSMAWAKQYQEQKKD